MLLTRTFIRWVFITRSIIVFCSVHEQILDSHHFGLIRPQVPSSLKICIKLLVLSMTNFQMIIQWIGGKGISQQCVLDHPIQGMKRQGNKLGKRSGMNDYESKTRRAVVMWNLESPLIIPVSHQHYQLCHDNPWIGIDSPRSSVRRAEL